MKPRSTTITREDTLQAEKIRFGIDAADLPHLMDVLTNLYSDPVLAVIREYASNAYDSHVAAGNPDPIEVELPNDLRRTYVVRDHGVGLSIDEVLFHLTKYGWSSKRDDDAQIGTLGLGCKSGLTYTDQFSLLTVKNGVQASVVVSRDEDGAAILQVVDTRATDAPNGVEVTIPVSGATWAFNERAREFFRFWQPGTVLVDGQEPTCIFTEAKLSLDPDIAITPNVDSDYVVMGNVPYRANVADFLGYSHNVIARVDIGAIDFTPSREELHHTARTRGTLETIADFVRERLSVYIQEQINLAETHLDALRVRADWKDVAGALKLSTASFRFRGKTIPNHVNVSGYNFSRGYHLNAAKKMTYVAAEVLLKPGTSIVWGHVASNPRAQTKQDAIDRFAGTGVTLFTTADGPQANSDTEWLQDLPSCHYSEFARPRGGGKRQAGAPRQKTKWEVLRYRTHCLVDTLPDGPLVYIRLDENGPANYGYRSRTSYRRRDDQRDYVTEFFARHAPDVTVLLVPTPKLQRLFRLRPDAKHYSEWIHDEVADIDAQLTEDQKLRERATHPITRIGLDALDPDVVAVTERLNATIAAGKLHQRRGELAGNNLGVEVGALSSLSDLNKRLEDVTYRYPLAEWRYSTNDADILEYMNATYLYRKNGSQ